MTFRRSTVNPNVSYDQCLAHVYACIECGALDGAFDEVLPLKVRAVKRLDLLILGGKILLAQQEWNKAAILACAAVKKYNEVADFYIQAGLAFEMLGDFEKAKSAWLSAPAHVQKTDYFHYNMAYCQIRLGYFSSACFHIRSAIAINAEIRKYMRKDPYVMPFLANPGCN